ncbi:hypothetical protein QBC42DRAFT_171826 [Cladorrhinum samala]|uniref:Uncharacterized protein n=1 Tax=Cladorrhinum samala TaxID=585594 RepID=A0AAV9HTL6_9PEZI|nr:hypothetical protein QBC42DRAFT_171826 [Cladorrhinum samala]
MASNNLPAGAFLTTIDGRRCTAVPRVAAAASSSSTTSTSVAQVTTTLSTIVQTTTTAAATSVIATPTTAIVAVAAGDQEAAPRIIGQESSTSTSTTSSSPEITAVIPPRGSSLSTTLESPSQPSSNAGPNGSAADTTASDSVSQGSPQNNNNAVKPTLAVAGGVIGGVVAISIIAFLFWWWRRQRLRRRRSTLLTPLNMTMPFSDNGNDEKGGYVIDRGSIGPTPVATKVRTALGANIQKIRGHLRNKTGASSAPSVNMDRGTSQFMDSSASSTHSRSNSAFDREPGEPTRKDRFVDWWSRLTADINFNWRLRNARNSEIDTLTPMGNPPSYGTNEKRPPLPAGSSQPDFLTLLRMDDSELDREAQRRRAGSNGSRPGSGSGQHFLSGLGLSFGNNNSSDNPFSDAHASAQPAPLFDNNNQPSQPQPPSSYYVKESIRRSRANSVATTAYNPATPGVPGPGRDSLASVSSFVNNRNKFRSDPFDLELPNTTAAAAAAFPGSNKLSIISSNAGTAGSSTRHSRVSMIGIRVGDVRRPAGAHVRAESFTSKYSSGISLGGDWSDPGPDVGPLGAWGGQQSGGRRGSAGSSGSGGSVRSGGVGKAM